MADNKYCYPNTDILKNRLDIRDKEKLFRAEAELTIIRVNELQENPIVGNFDFQHLRRIHKYIFQDIYDWAGEIREVEIGKGNLFCTTAHILTYGESVFNKYFAQCNQVKDDRIQFAKVFAENYADLNALHPFREGNGRAQREFARMVCLECGYIFDLSHTTHEAMLNASKLSFDRGDSTLLYDIFVDALTSQADYITMDNHLQIFTADDLIGIFTDSGYQYYESEEVTDIEKYNVMYAEKTEYNIQQINELVEQDKLSESLEP